jgi:hypothetical protein
MINAGMGMIHLDAVQSYPWLWLMVSRPIIAATVVFDSIPQASTRVEPVGVAAHTTFRCDTETYVLLTYGRLPLRMAMATGRLVVEGGQGLVPAFGQWFQGA